MADEQPRRDLHPLSVHDTSFRAIGLGINLTSFKIVESLFDFYRPFLGQEGFRNYRGPSQEKKSMSFINLIFKNHISELQISGHLSPQPSGKRKT